MSKIKEKDKKSIVVIIDDAHLQDFIALILLGEGFLVKTYFTDTSALDNLLADKPDIIISDFKSQRVDGIKVCKFLQQIPLLYLTQIIFLLEENTSPLEKMKIIYSGADDYIEKPLTSDKLLMTIKMSLRRSQRLDIHPLTLLPGASTAIKVINKKIAEKETFAAAYLDLLHLRYYNERYGYLKGNEVLLYLAELLRETIFSLGSPSDFLAHLLEDDFLFLTEPAGAEEIAQKIITEFSQGALQFYNEEDRGKGYCLMKNRKGETQKIPLLRLSIGITTNENYAFITPVQVFQIAKELNAYAKTFPKSMFVKERRKTYPFY